MQIKSRARSLELVTLGMQNGRWAQRPAAVSRHLPAGGRCGRGERTQADVIDYLRHFVVGADDYLNDWLTREKSG
jgi:hypothetical protein